MTLCAPVLGQPSAIVPSHTLAGISDEHIYSRTMVITTAPSHLGRQHYLDVLIEINTTTLFIFSGQRSALSRTGKK